MTDLLTRLRRLYVQHGTDYVQEAADEIERLRAELARKDEFYTRLAEVHEGAMKMWESDERECAMKAYEMAAELKGLREEVDNLRHDIERHVAIASVLATENERLRAERAEARKPNLVWDFDEPEDSSTDSIVDAVYQYVDWFGGDVAIGQEITFLTARKLPNVTVRITSINDDGEVTYEEVPTVPVRLREYAGHKPHCLRTLSMGRSALCDCGYDELMADLGEGK